MDKKKLPLIYLDHRRFLSEALATLVELLCLVPNILVRCVSKAVPMSAFLLDSPHMYQGDRPKLPIWISMLPHPVILNLDVLRPLVIHRIESKILRTLAVPKEWRGFAQPKVKLGQHPPKSHNLLHANIHRLVFTLQTRSSYHGLQFRLPGQWTTCSIYDIACCGPPGQRITRSIGIGEFMQVKHAFTKSNIARHSTTYILHQVHHEMACMHSRFRTKAR